MIVAEPCASMQEATAALNNNARNAGRMTDLYAKVSGVSLTASYKGGMSIVCAARDLVRVSGDVSVTGRWDLKSCWKGLPLSMPLTTESRERESMPASTR